MILVDTSVMVVSGVAGYSVEGRVRLSPKRYSQSCSAAAFRLAIFWRHKSVDDVVGNA
jgi:hypothetical protein